MEYSMENERILIARAQKDPEAFGAVYGAHYQKIFRYIYYRVASRDIAEDLAAETFFQALKNIWRFQFTRHPFSSWLYRIATIQIALYYRQKKKYCTLAMEECPELMNFPHESAKTIVHEIESQKDMITLHSFIKTLKEEEQNILALRYFEEKSIQDISQILRMKENTVKSHIRRGLIHLKELYQKESNSLLYELPERRTTQRNRKEIQEREIA